MTKSRHIADLSSDEVLTTSDTGVDVTGAVTATGMVIDNGSADGGSLSFKSAGFNDWNLDNSDGALRTIYNGQVPYTIDGTNITHVWRSPATGEERMRIDTGGNVGIGTSSPFSTLSVNTGVTAPSTSGNMASNAVTFHNTSFGRAVQIGLNEAGGYNYLQSGYVNNADVPQPFAFLVGASEAMRIDSAGRVTMPYQPAFDVRDGGSTGTLVFTTVSSNVGNHYNASNGLFTAPVNGHYLFTLTVGNNSAYTVDILKNNVVYRRNEIGSPAGFYWTTSSVVVYLTAGDYVHCGVVSGTTSSNTPYGGFSGCLLG